MSHLHLHIGAEHTSLGQAQAQAAQQQTSMPVGWQTALACGKQPTLPTAAALELAIMQVEDAISASWPQRLALDTVSSSDPAIYQMAALCGLPQHPGSQLGRHSVEGLFSRLANAVEGGAAAGLPDSAEFIASLLILRELLHHLDIATITLTRPAS
ncbi:hypothetical protein DBR44_15745 [Aquitalea sp. FJL05]|uniref:hypothetical protein n=1 Tax=Aquitalea TaxID=407217 RepID=UPI000F5ABE4F|nr:MULTISPECIES: hypothetical protein [Aquitalea]RQO68144.1 hypothetical protein DBR44_15745 [Aquitalea sp. FJL05]